MAASTVAGYFRSEARTIRDWLVASALGHDANAKIFARADDSRAHRGMGTTIVARVLSTDAMLYIAHAGDSRCYRLRDGRWSSSRAITRSCRTRSSSARISPERPRLPAAQRHHARARHRPHRRARRARRARARGDCVPPLLRRPARPRDGRRHREDRRGAPCSPRLARPDPARERERRQGQHHRVLIRIEDGEGPVEPPLDPRRDPRRMKHRNGERPPFSRRANPSERAPSSGGARLLGCPWF
jgi:hypothetical protein